MTNGVYTVTSIDKDGKFVLTRVTEPVQVESNKCSLTSLTMDGEELLPAGLIQFDSIEELNAYVNHHLLKGLGIDHDCYLCHENEIDWFLAKAARESLSELEKEALKKHLNRKKMSGTPITFLLLNCHICKTTPKIKDHIQDDMLMAVYINCDKCNIHGPFKHVPEHGYEKACEVAAKEWNAMQNKILEHIK